MSNDFEHDAPETRTRPEAVQPPPPPAVLSPEVLAQHPGLIDVILERQAKADEVSATRQKLQELLQDKLADADSQRSAKKRSAARSAVAEDPEVTEALADIEDATVALRAANDQFQAAAQEALDTDRPVIPLMIAPRPPTPELGDA